MEFPHLRLSEHIWKSIKLEPSEIKVTSKAYTMRRTYYCQDFDDLERQQIAAVKASMQADGMANTYRASVYLFRFEDELLLRISYSSGHQ